MCGGEEGKKGEEERERETQRLEWLMAEALGRCALILYMYNAAVCIAEKFYLESEL